MGINKPADQKVAHAVGRGDYQYNSRIEASGSIPAGRWSRALPGISSNSSPHPRLLLLLLTDLTCTLEHTGILMSLLETAILSPSFEIGSTYVFSTSKTLFNCRHPNIAQINMDLYDFFHTTFMEIASNMVKKSFSIVTVCLLE